MIKLNSIVANQFSKKSTVFNMNTNTEKQQFAQQLKAAMTAMGYEAKASILEREFNLRYYGNPVTIQGVTKWLRGQSIPRADKVITLAKWLQIEPSQLVCGIEMKEHKKQWKDEIGYQDREICEAFINLPTPQKKIVREVILTFSKSCKS